MDLFSEIVCRDIGSFQIWLGSHHHLNHVNPTKLILVQVGCLDFFLLSVAELDEDNSNEQVEEDIGSNENEDHKVKSIDPRIIPDWS